MFYILCWCLNSDSSIQTDKIVVNKVSMLLWLWVTMETYSMETDFSDNNIFQIIAATMVGEGEFDPLCGFIVIYMGCGKLKHTQNRQAMSPGFTCRTGTHLVS